MSITIRGLTLGAGRPKIIVPILAQTVEESARQAAQLIHNPAAELIELRLDGLADPSAEAMADALREVRQILGVRADSKPLLVTLRTKAEGGMLALDFDAYAARLDALLAAGGADLIDIEYSAGAGVRAALRTAAQAAGVFTVFSHHEFTATPPAAEMTNLLCAMGADGADIAKLAVMPAAPADVAALLLATAQAKAKMPGRPLITMSMGAAGAVSRVCGGAFGSAATFGAVTLASAPGQPGAAELHAALDALQKCL